MKRRVPRCMASSPFYLFVRHGVNSCCCSFNFHCDYHFTSSFHLSSCTMPSDLLHQTEETYFDDNGQEGEVQHQQRKRFARSSQACTHCRHLKMKCSGSIPCERCLRNGKSCEESRRPARGSWSRKKDVEIQSLSQRLEEMEQKVKNSQSRIVREEQLTQQIILRRSEEETSSVGNALSAIPPRPPPIPLHDTSLSHLPFVHTGTISADEATFLYKDFMYNCCQHVPLLDAEWHSIQQVSNSCPFLFACIVYVAAIY
jgi:hypothetical protein